MWLSARGPAGTERHRGACRRARADLGNKSDLSTDVEADHYMSVTEDDNVDGVLQAAIDAVDYDSTAV